MSVFWLQANDLFRAALKELQPVNVVLDIGCGIRPQNFIKPSVHICCEPFEQYITVLQDAVKTNYDRNFVIIKATWEDVTKFFPAKSVDTVFLVDVIEHIEKEEALALLQASEAIVRHQIAIFTPLGFMPQYHPDGKDAWGLDGGAWQEHKSGWQPDDFDDSWSVFAAKEFHNTDNMGKPLENPFGALWAIKTLKLDAAKPPVHTKRQKAHILVDNAIDFLKF